MISLKNSFLVAKPAEEVFKLFSQIDKLAWAFPTVQRVDVLDQDHVTIGVLLKLGLLPLDNNISLEVVERQHPNRLLAEGVATPGAGLARAAKVIDSDGATHIKMLLELEDLDEGNSRVRYQIDCSATGNLKRIYDAIIKGQRKNLESEFIKNVSEILQVPIHEEQPIG